MATLFELSGNGGLPHYQSFGLRKVGFGENRLRRYQIQAGRESKIGVANLFSRFGMN